MIFTREDGVGIRAGELDMTRIHRKQLARPSLNGKPRTMPPAEEAKVATVFATPAMKAIRHLIDGLSPAEIDEIVQRVRRELWKDFS